MPWLVGIDEAGYGPNLGPFVMSLAAVHVSDPSNENVWALLSDAVCRAGEVSEGRLVVDDSKTIHQAGQGYGRLEANLLPFQLAARPHGRTLAELWPEAGQALCDAAEPWYRADVELPCRITGARVASASEKLYRACRAAGVASAAIRSVLLLPRRVNELTRKLDSKAAVTLHALRELLAMLPELCDRHPIRITVDKLGGRHYYRGLLEECFGEAMILSCGESAERSVYRVCCREKEYEVTFAARAEAESFSTALASMASKYLREVLMEQFNGWWGEQVPGLRPTAGYPGDAARFWKDIAAARARLDIDDDALWRER